MIRVEE